MHLAKLQWWKSRLPPALAGFWAMCVVMLSSEYVLLSIFSLLSLAQWVSQEGGVMMFIQKMKLSFLSVLINSWNSSGCSACSIRSLGIQENRGKKGDYSGDLGARGWKLCQHASELCLWAQVNDPKYSCQHGSVCRDISRDWLWLFAVALTSVAVTETPEKRAATQCFSALPEHSPCFALRTCLTAGRPELFPWKMTRKTWRA